MKRPPTPKHTTIRAHQSQVNGSDAGADVKLEEGLSFFTNEFFLIEFFYCDPTLNDIPGEGSTCLV